MLHSVLIEHLLLHTIDILLRIYDVHSLLEKKSVMVVVAISLLIPSSRFILLFLLFCRFKGVLRLTRSHNRLHVSIYICSQVAKLSSLLNNSLFRFRSDFRASFRS